MYYIIENKVKKYKENDINLIYYSDDIDDINNFIINYISELNCVLINDNITNELYNKKAGLYYQYKYNNLNKNNIIDNENQYDNIVIYEKYSSYIPFVNSYKLNTTLYIKKYISSKISLFRYDANNDIKNKKNNLFGQITNFNLNSLKNKKNILDVNLHEKSNDRKISFIEELKNNKLFNSRRSKIKLHDSIDNNIQCNENIESNNKNIESNNENIDYDTTCSYSYAFGGYDSSDWSD
jgi:hypothetical protein